MQILMYQERFIIYMNLITKLEPQSTAFPFEFLALSCASCYRCHRLTVMIQAQDSSIILLPTTRCHVQHKGRFTASDGRH